MMCSSFSSISLFTLIILVGTYHLCLPSSSPCNPLLIMLVTPLASPSPCLITFASSVATSNPFLIILCYALVSDHVRHMYDLMLSSCLLFVCLSYFCQFLLFIKYLSGALILIRLYDLIHYPSFLFVITLSSIISFVPTPPHMTPQPFDSLPLHRPDNVGIAPDVEEESHVRLSIPCVLMACSCLFELCPHRAKFFAYSLKLVFIIFVMLLKAFIILFNITFIISSMSHLIMFPSPSSLSY